MICYTFFVGVDLQNLPDDIEELKRIIAAQNSLLLTQNTLIEKEKSELHNKRIEVKILEEKVSLLQSRLFSKSSEKMGPVAEAQAVLFNEIESLYDSEPELPMDEDSQVTVSTHKRSKSGKKRLPDDLERREEIIDIPESEKTCTCGTTKSRIGEEVSEKLDYKPAEAFVRRIVRPKYACRKCHGADDEGQAVAIALAKPTLLGKSILAEGIFGHMIVSKFMDGLPFYRQETIFRRSGIEVS